MTRDSPTQMIVRYELWGLNDSHSFFRLSALYDPEKLVFPTISKAKQARTELVTWYASRIQPTPWKKLYIVRTELTGTVLYGE